MTVLKARLEENPKLRSWLIEQGTKITALPTLVLVSDGQAKSKMVGADKIMNAGVLENFVLDKQPDEAIPITNDQGVDLLQRVRRLFPALA